MGNKTGIDRDFLDALPDAVIVVDHNGVVQQANRNVPNVLGYTPSEVTGMQIEELLREEDRHDHVRYRQDYMKNPDPRPMGQELDLYALRKDGTTVPVEISLGPTQQSDEVQVVATITDISRRREQQRELQRQKDRLEEFAEVVSHDLRNPLNVAKGRLEIVAENCKSEHLDDVFRALSRMETLINHVLDLAREGQPVGELEEVDLNSIVETCWRNIETEEASLVSEVNYTIQADPTRLQQLLENLLRNAVDHGGRDVTVKVSDLCDGFAVEDDGPGIAPNEQTEVFEPGYTTTMEGTGFGLAIVKEIADAHGWEIDVSNSDAGGARFEFTGVAIVN